ncbi:MAG: hypothetical protein J5829_10455 [Lachnospiraceae bacterium]|nr:hypothetical protein [Lachnospiraceae bacterium]
MKRVLRSVTAVVLAFVMTAGSACFVFAEEEEAKPVKKGAYEEKKLPVYKGEMTDETITVRYYDESPNVPYIGIKEYYDCFIEESLDKKDTPMSVEKSDDDIYILKNAHGEATIDVGKGEMSFDDMAEFTNLMGLVQEGMSNCYLDGLPYVRIKELKNTGDGSRTLDFAKYDIKIYGDDDDVYLPESTLSDIFTDLVYHYTACNGETVYFNTVNTCDHEMVLTIDPDFSKPFMESLDDDMNRPEDLADFSFKELCFSFDNFYGLPGRAVLNDDLEEKGLEEALLEYGKEGKETIELLKSANLVDYLTGFDKLQLFVDDAGHTKVNVDKLGNAKSDELKTELNEKKEEVKSDFKKVQKEDDRIGDIWDYIYPRKQMRDDAYKGERYIKKGDTAVFVLDSFMGFNMDKLNDYYKGDAAKPTIMTMKDDDMLLIDACMKDAEDDPEIKNFVIDISNNTGGSLDEVAMLCSLVTGQRETSFLIENAKTGQKTVETYEADLNFDKEFDEKDERKPYDLNFAILTSTNSFSCGNAFPSAMKDMGYPIMGEQSGGGGCAVLVQTTGEGFTYRMSAYKGRLLNEDEEQIDNGIPVDVDLVRKRENGKPKYITVNFKYEGKEYEGRTPDYSDFYDIDRLSEEVNKLYSED